MPETPAPPPLDAGATALSAAESSHSGDLPYEIVTDEARGLLQMVMRGTWDMLVFEQFATAYLDAIESLSRHGGVTHQLVDGRDYAVQPIEISDRFQPLVQAAHYPDCQRTALVIPAMVNRVQARPSGDILNARYFKTLEDAEQWLFSSEA